jgi:hypothetical protein
MTKIPPNSQYAARRRHAMIRRAAHATERQRGPSLLTGPRVPVAAYAPWGIEPFDRQYGGLARSQLNVLAVPERMAAIAAAGHFLAYGLTQGQRVALVALDNALLVCSQLAYYGFDFHSALETEQLVFIYYKPVFPSDWNMPTDYAALFAEIRALAGNINRLALLNADVLTNSQTPGAARASVARLATGATTIDVTTLTCLAQRTTRETDFLTAACRQLLPCYLELRRVPPAARAHYSLTWASHPYTHTHTQPATLLELEAGYGYRSADRNTARPA